MPLINDIETVRFNGVNVQFINDNSSIADMTAAEEKYIKPIIGDDLYNALVDQVTYESEPNSQYEELLLKVQRALAPLAYYLDLPNIQAQITDRGTATFTSENMQPLHRWEFEELRENLADKGSFALEKLIEYLHQHKEDLAWQAPENLKTIFVNGLQFSNYFPVYQPHRTFESLGPIVKQIEDLYIIPAIGETFFQSLRDSSAPNTQELVALSMIRTATAYLTIKTATEILPVKISVNGFTVTMLDAYDKTFQGSTQAPDKQMSALRASSERTGELYILKLKSFLNATASDSVFAEYKNSIYYTPPSTISINPNVSRNGVFGL